MKVLLRDEQSRHYYSGNEAWVAEMSKAWNFGSIERAGQQAQECHPRVLSVVLKYDNPECELALNPVFCFRGRTAENR
jgi:hypothetical protein